MSAKIGVIISTTRPTRLGRNVAEWFMGKVKDNNEMSFELIDLKEVNLPFLNEEHSPSTGKYELEPTKKWSERINGYDGFVFVTAEYNNGIPAPLKNAIDSVYHEWDRKPVAFVGYGTYGGVRAVEHLATVTAKVGMAPLTKTVVGINTIWNAVKEDGSLDESFVMGSVDGLVDNLQWWVKALQAAKS